MHAFIGFTLGNRGGIQLISAAFEHSVLCVQEIYALENVVLYIAVYGPYEPIYAMQNVQTQLKSTIAMFLG